ncbi:PcfJ domain-containing protein, partial [Blautia pseudococcoides]|uniref:PcfJ domain-containing protein n=1 Tax=Blautia pseudococcoides TaxID=1796616 RepID=UPI003519B7D4
NANRPDEFLGIRKERVKQLIENRGDTVLLETMQIERRMQQVWTDEQLRHLTETQLKRGDIETATRYMSLQRLLNQIEKYAGCEYETGCSTAMDRIRQTATTYMDYLNMRLALGYDLNNTVYQQPRRLGEAHAKMVMETNKEETDKRLQEVKEKFPNIRHDYRALRKRYIYEDDNYIIRPARSAEEIVVEGRILHHCVGGDNYLQKHNDGTTYILMLRHKADPETPYITAEIDGTQLRIVQWYGSNDRKPDGKIMQKWLDNYITKLKSGNMTPMQTDEAAIA